MAFSVNNLNSVADNISMKSLSSLNKMIKQAICEFICIKFPCDLNFKTIKAICFSDASFGNVKMMEVRADT